MSSRSSLRFSIFTLCNGAFMAGVIANIIASVVAAIPSLSSAVLPLSPSVAGMVVAPFFIAATVAAVIKVKPTISLDSFMIMSLGGAVLVMIGLIGMFAVQHEHPLYWFFLSVDFVGAMGVMFAICYPVRTT